MVEGYDFFEVWIIVKDIVVNGEEFGIFLDYLCGNDGDIINDC